MKRGSIITVVFLLVFLWLSGPVFAAVPWLVGYQGKVTDSEQVPLDGTYTMIFRLYSFEGATSPIWAEEQMVSVTDGVFQVQLGAGANIVGGDLDSTLIAGQDRWLEIEIEGEVLDPRQRLTSTAYALRAETADSALRIAGALPSRITADDEGYALSVSNSGSGGAADLDGFVNVDHGNLLVQGDGSFDANGEAGALYLGDSMNYIKAVHGSGVSIGTFNADDAIVVEQGTGNVGIGTNTPAARLDVAGSVHASGTLGVGSAAKNLAVFTDGAVVDLKSTGAALGINYPGDTDTVINVNGGRVGIGVDPPSEKLSVNGTVESTSGGFKFPDGSSQASAGASQIYVSALEARIVSLEAKMAAMEILLDSVTRSGSDITFSGVNVHVVNGTGTTDGTPNGLGNLIVGYNEVRGDGDDRSGSHNVVIGSRNNYASFGGLVAGYYNTISGKYAGVSGGSSNTASGDYASVSGGANNTASGNNASISGGSYNKASGRSAFVGGGGSGNSSDGNEAFGDYSAILGGHNNLAGDPEKSDHSVGINATIGGGGYNKASGQAAFVGGGGGNNTYFNEAFGDYTAILGGHSNHTGDPERSDHSVGQYATISGGWYNRASYLSASVSGGEFNIASGQGASVSGGVGNTARNWASSVSGGSSNTASGPGANVSGGGYNTASNTNASVSGGGYNTASGICSFVGGGGGIEEYKGNLAFANYSAILGGSLNGTGDVTMPPPVGTIGVIPGSDHTVGSSSTVSGGNHNSASGSYDSVSGGSWNTASGGEASVSGGSHNHAAGGGASISGGYANQARITGTNASISGGFNNTVSADSASVTGGFHNIASGVGSSVSGGETNHAIGFVASISGGRYNTASGDYSFVGGGGHSNSDYGNEAFSNYSAILGGSYNIAGDNTDPNHSTGELATIAGGDTNRAKGGWSSIAGGRGNIANNNHTTVSGGDGNTASNAFDSVVGDNGAVYVDNTPVH